MQQITQQAFAMATAASAGQQGQQAATDPNPSANSTTSTGTGTPTNLPHPPHPPQARVVITRPAFAPRVPQPNLGTRGATINLRATVPPSVGQQPGQVNDTPFCSGLHVFSSLCILLFFQFEMACLWYNP